MILTAHQPVYLPWLGLFHKIALADKFIFFDQVQHVPKDYINRNYVKTSSGPVLLTVPVLSKGYLEKKIADIEINNNDRWASKHWKTIYLNYKNTPYFKDYACFFEDLYKQEWKYLADLNFYMLKWHLETLGINIPVERAKNYNFQGVKSDLVLDMCLQLKSDVYIFGSMGKDYADTDKFNRVNVVPVFQDYIHPEYNQLHGKYAPYMSTIDLIFNEGSKSLEIIMSGNITKEDLIKIDKGR